MASNFVDPGTLRLGRLSVSTTLARRKVDEVQSGAVPPPSPSRGQTWWKIPIHLACGLLIQPFASLAEGLSAIWAMASEDFGASFRVVLSSRQLQARLLTPPFPLLLASYNPQASSKLS